MRHTQPVDASVVPDAERYLTEAGREHAQAVGAALAERGVALDFVVCSPLTRAVQTAELASAAAGYSGVVVTRGAIASGNGLRHLASELEGMGQHVLVVGHAPLLSTLGSSLVGGPFPPFAKGQVCAVIDGAIEWTIE